MWREHSRARRIHAGPTHYCEVHFVRGVPALPALGGLRGQAFSSASEAASPFNRWEGRPMTPRFKGVPQFDFSIPCPACGYKIQPNELERLEANSIRCPGCQNIFDQLAGRKPLSTS
jgi:hypothetical protein